MSYNAKNGGMWVIIEIIKVIIKVVTFTIFCLLSSYVLLFGKEKTGIKIDWSDGNTMRYTEKDLKTKYDNFTDYLSSIIELLILSPFRLINEISKKVVYLEQKRIEKMLLVAAMISVLVIALEVVIGFCLNDFNPVSGKFPIAFQALAPIIILLLWGFVKNYDFSLHSKLEEILTKQSEAEDLTKEDENTVKESKSSPKTENTFTGFQEDEDTSQDEKIELDDFDDDSFEE